MIDQADERLGEWVRGVLGDVHVSFAPPGVAPGIHLYLLEIAEAKEPQTTSPPPLRFRLRYLVTAAAEDPREAHRQLGELLFAALADPAVDIALDAAPAAVWQALGIAPQPTFMLEVPLERARERRPAVPVREVMLGSSPLGELAGVVVGPGDIPLAQARVELPALSRSTVTDSRGRFQLSGVPLGAAAGEMQVHARGRRWTLPVAAGATPLIVRLDLMEEEHA